MPSDVTIDREEEGLRGTLHRVRHAAATALRRVRPHGVAASSKALNRMTAIHLAIAFIALFIGVTTGVLQALEHGGVNLYPKLAPVVRSYYQGLSLHGVLNVLVFTTFFIVGFFQFLAPRAYDQPLASRSLGWATVGVMVGGLVLAAIPLLVDAASVMFTFYAPMKAHPAFYIGLTLVVVGTWLVTANLLLTHRAWRKKHPDTPTPLAAFMCLVTMLMWSIASLGIASEMLFLVIPWSLGWTSGIDPLLSRSLFWMSGHPIVYFWVLAAYVSWYTLLPRQVGGRLFSDPMARGAFVMFLVLSTPVGFHHQYTDPGIARGWKFVHGFLTFALFFPSLLTFFNVGASIESGARARGGKGLLMWWRKVPWGDPSAVAQILAMATFAFGGSSGLINASLSLNLIVHNTTWVPGHLHLTVGTAATLTFMGIAYWLVPHLRRRPLFSRRLALVQAWAWVGGMAFFSHSMHRLGLLGAPRRTAIGAAPYLRPEWSTDLTIVAIGGSVLFLSALLFFVNIVMTVVASRGPAPEALAFAESNGITAQGARFFDRLGLWVVVAFVLIAVAYGPTIARIATTSPFDVPGLRVW